MTQPQYSLAVKNEFCSFMAYVNDVPAIFNPDGYAFNLNVPINHLIQSGKNTFRLIVTLQDKSDETENYFECISEILVKGTYDPMTSLKSLSRVDLRSIVKGSVLELPPSTPVSGVFHVQEPISDLPWSNGLDMSKRKSHYINLAIDGMKLVHKYLINQDLENLFKLISDREKHYSSRYFEDFAIGFSKTKADFAATLEDPDFTLQDLDFTTYLPVFYAGGKLITFENIRGEQAVFFLNNKKNLMRQYPIYFFCQDEKNIEIAL